MTNVVNHLIFGIINQPQIWIEHKGEKMTNELNPIEKEEQKINVRVQGGSSGAVYGLGLIGACIFYISRGTTYQEKILGFLKALVWPVFLVNQLLEFLDKN